MRKTLILLCVVGSVALPAHAGVLSWTAKRTMQGAGILAVGAAAHEVVKHRRCKTQPYLAECQTPIESNEFNDDTGDLSADGGDPEFEAELPLMKNGEKLAKDMAKKGMGTRPAGCSAHHIVPETAKRKTAADARQLWLTCFGINSAENGVYLPQDPNSNGQCPGSFHSKIHTKIYYKNLYDRLRTAVLNTTGTYQDKCTAMKDEVDTIRQQLLNKSLPY